MVDSKSASPSAPLIEHSADDLPSYDSVTGSASLPCAHASGSSPPPPALTAQQIYLFSSPLNAEDLTTPVSHEVEHVHCKQRLDRIQLDRDPLLTRVIGIDTCDEATSDPELLCDFLKSTAARVPQIRLRCSGSHTETSQFDTSVSINGRWKDVKKGESYTVFDFEFWIDMSGLVCSQGVALSVLPSSTPAYRGKTSAAYGADYEPARSSLDGYKQPSPYGGRHSLATSGLRLSWAAHSYLNTWNKKRWGMGFPVWAKISDIPGDVMGTGDVGDVERDCGLDATLLEWCEAYCAKRGWLKRFILRREVWGWNFAGLVKATKAAIVSTGYSHQLKVRVEWDEAEVVVRPSNRWNRANENIYIHLALCITLIYPIIWLLDYAGLLFGSSGKFDVARATYNLKPYVPLPSTYPTESLQSARDRLSSIIKSNPHLPADPELRLGPKGVHYLAGRKEGEWFADWEDRIKMATQSGYRGEIYGRAEPLARDLSMDGFERRWVAAE